MIHNVHERLLPVPVERVSPLLDTIGRPGDLLWPSPEWVPMVLDRPVSVGAAGGHGPIRYRVTGYRAGRSVEFTFEPGMGLDGTHTFVIEPVGPERTLIRHVARGSASGSMRLVWPLAVRWLHDAVLEDLFDRAESALGIGPERPARWSPWVRLLRGVGFAGPSARSVAVPATPLLADALPRVDFSDAHAVSCRPGLPADPQVWADAVFRDPPKWVVALLGLREAIVGLVGIARGGWKSFDTVARSEDEVLLGADERHLDFRASVLREPDRVVVGTVVRLHSARGRAYFALVRPVHPVIVRAMLTRAARRLAGRSRAERLGAQWSR
ncbi:DUF2867 domain-containing protein [Pseudonocardia acaciae]|uniref:DUF2867 domain-containing protein n=1 Tax=Pseudonocardia acaciae TaxID=551276 RepID=UPI0005620097|nr:DUF2867 domain-containing protein [Pseudonocardia acaciae]